MTRCPPSPARLTAAQLRPSTRPTESYFSSLLDGEADARHVSVKPPSDTPTAREVLQLRGSPRCDTASVIAALTLEDLPDCVELFTHTFSAPPWSEPWTQPDAARRLGDLFAIPGATGVCARDSGGDLDGCAVGRRERSIGQDHFLLSEMCVKAARQRSGIGGQLLMALAERLPDVEHWYLLTARDSAPAAFYEANSFRPIDTMRVFVRR